MKNIIRKGLLLLTFFAVLLACSLKSPTMIAKASGSDILDIQSGAMLKSDHTVWVWGDNQFSDEMNYSLNKGSLTPVPYEGLTDVTQISVSGYRLALKKDGTVWQWGKYNVYEMSPGYQSIFSYDYSKSLVMIPGLTNIKSISAGSSHGMALSENGEVWVWGPSIRYEAGDPYRNNDMPVKLDVTDVKQIAACVTTSLVLKNDGTVWGIGDNSGGQLGDTGKSWSAKMVKVEGLPSLKQIWVDAASIFGLDYNNNIWVWGDNTNRCLGLDMNYDGIAIPQKLEKINNVTSIVRNVFVKTDGTVWLFDRDMTKEEDGQIEYSELPIKAKELEGKFVVSVNNEAILRTSDGEFYRYCAAYSGLGFGENEQYEIVKVNPDELGTNYSLQDLNVERSDPKSTIKTGMTSQISFIGVYDNGIEKDITKYIHWKVSDESVATYQDGIVTYLSEGRCTLSYHYGEFSGSMGISCGDVPENDEEDNEDADNEDAEESSNEVKGLVEIVLSKEYLELQPGEAQTITITAIFENGKTIDVTNEVTWANNYETIVDCSKGKITGINEGEALLFAYYKDARVDLSVLVEERLDRYEISKDDIKIGVGKNKSLSVTAYYNDDTKEVISKGVQWYSDNEKIASVKAGKIEGKGTGSTNIWAVIGDKKVSTKVTVHNYVVSISSSIESIVMKKGKTQKVTIKAKYEDGTTKNITQKINWKITKKSIISIDNGVVTGLKNGFTTILAEYKVYNPYEEHDDYFNVVIPVVISSKKMTIVTSP